MQQERDALLTEKEQWKSQQSANGTVEPNDNSEELRQKLDAEKAALQKSLDDSNSRVKVRLILTFMRSMYF